MKRVIFLEGEINEKNMKVYNQYKAHNQLKGLSEKTIDTYEYDLFQWFKYLNVYQEDKTYDEVEEEDIEEFLMHCKLEGNNASRLQRRCSVISSFYIFLRRKRKISNNPLEFIDRPKKKLDVREKHFLTQEQIISLKSKLHELDNIVAETFVLLALNTAARRNALMNIKWSDINFEEREIDAIEKGPKQVILYFSEEMKHQLIRLKKYYIEKGILQEYVFLSKYRGKYKHCGKNTPGVWVKRAGQLIGINNLAPHSLRRTAATQMVHSGMELMDVSLVLNHISIDTTRIYVRRDKKKLKNLKDAINI